MWEDDPSEPLSTAVAFGIFYAVIITCGIVMGAVLVGNALCG